MANYVKFSWYSTVYHIIVALLAIIGICSVNSFENKFFLSAPEVTELIDTEHGTVYKGLVGEVEVAGQYNGRRLKREPKKSNSSFYKGKAWVFLNIPYAKPLTSETVFDLPQSLNIPEYNQIMESRCKNDTNLRRFGNYCPQVESEMTEYYDKYCYSQMDIDCLNLNVFSPPLNTTTKAKFPVYVLLHGGKFVRGSACDFGRQGLIHNFVTNGVIVVTINYRLGLYGFLKKSGNDVNSNRGLYDQIVALNWVKHHIKTFNGDPHNVTLGGFDSGACSATMLTLASLYNKTLSLFNNVILHGTTAELCLKGGVFDQEVTANYSIDALKKNVSLHNELTREYKLGMQYEVPDSVFDKPMEMIKKASDSNANRHLNILMGINHDELIGFGSPIDAINYTNVTEEQLLQFFTENVKVANFRLNGWDAKELLEIELADLFNSYSKNGLHQLLQDYTFVHNFFRLTDDLSNMGHSVYVYRFEHFAHPDLYYDTEIFANSSDIVPHGADVRYGYLAPQYWKKIIQSENETLIKSERQIGEDFAKGVLVNFIKTGKPTNGVPVSQNDSFDIMQHLPYSNIGKDPANPEVLYVKEPFYSQTKFELWERFAAFLITGEEATTTTTRLTTTTTPIPTTTTPVPTTTEKPVAETTTTATRLTTTTTPISTTTTTPIAGVCPYPATKCLPLPPDIACNRGFECNLMDRCCYPAGSTTTRSTTTSTTTITPQGELKCDCPASNRPVCNYKSGFNMEQCTKAMPPGEGCTCEDRYKDGQWVDQICGCY